MLVGSAQAGIPNEVYRLRNYQQALQSFRGGDLLDAIELAWNPGEQGAEAGEILAMRVEDAKNAKLEVPGLTFVSKIYGNEANEIKVGLSDNAITNTKRLRVGFSPDNYNETFDNLGKIFSIEYTGSEAQATYSVTEDPNVPIARKLVLKTGKDADSLEEEISFDLGDGANEYTNAVVSEINNLPDWEAKFFSIGDKNIETKYYDKAEDVDVKGSPAYIEALAGDIAKQLEYNEYVEVKIGGEDLDIDVDSLELEEGEEARVRAGQFAADREVENFPFQNLEGGSNGIIPTSWADKFRQFANIAGTYYLVPLTDLASVHAEALAFAKDRSDNGDPKRIFVGGRSNESSEQLVNRASNLKDPRAALVGFSGSRRMENGQLKRLPGYLMAAQVAGIASGQGVGEALTFKHFNVTELNRVLDGSELDALNEAGVITLEYVRNREQTYFRIVQDVTTYNDKTDPVKNEVSVGESTDFLVSQLKIGLDENFIGTKAVVSSASLIKNYVQSFLDDKKRSEEIQDYTPEEVQVVVDGDVAMISMTIMPVRSLNKISVSVVYKQQILTA